MVNVRSLSWLQVQCHSLSQRIKTLVWKEQSRGKTTAKSRGGSFAPKEPANLWKLDMEANLTSPVTSVETARDVLGVPGPTFINQTTKARSHSLGSGNTTPLAVYDQARKNLVAKFGAPYVDPIGKAQYWHAPALGQMMLPERPVGDSTRIVLIQYPVVSRLAFEGFVQRHNMLRAKV